MQKLTRIIMNGKTYPIKMDLNVLEMIQEKYGTINEFERDLLGLEFTTDDDGNQMYDKDGKPLMYVREVSVKAIKTALPAMINEGLSIEAEETRKEFEPVEDAFVFRNCNISFEVLGKIIHEEFRRCFEVKK